MERYHELLLEVWREACRHIEISKSTARIAAVLSRHVPLRLIVVRRVDLRRLCLETVAVGSVSDVAVESPARTDCSASELKRLTAWINQKRVMHRGEGGIEKEEAIILPGKISGDCLAGPLSGPDGNAGVLIMVAPEDERYKPHHLKLAEALLEPFSAALENDRRLHEMATLREAAEAERQALLTRLGRKELRNRIVGAEVGLRGVMERVEIVGKSDVPVLLLGETGTGKEVIARAIHTRSPRRDGPFIRVNCGAIPSELIDSQLFGHERGSFTGASETHRGWFERADGGSLFLDEIGELPPAAQVRLLRVLQDGYIERVGGKHPIHVDVRVVAATHADLAAMMSDGRFREDLWYRIAVFPIPIPPLRERGEDIPALACHFAQRAATRFGLSLVMPTREDNHLLIGYSWPGNVRELGAVIDRAALLGNGKRLEVAMALGAAPASAAGRSGAPAASVGSGIMSEDTSPRALDTQPASSVAGLDDAMRKHIESVLQATHGRIEGPFGAALRLNINPHTLRARMRKLGIEWRRFRTSARG